MGINPYGLYADKESRDEAQRLKNEIDRYEMELAYGKDVLNPKKSWLETFFTIIFTLALVFFIPALCNKYLVPKPEIPSKEATIKVE